MSKNGRADAPQIVIGLAVTRDGLPVRHWVFPGNTVDVSTVAQVKDDLKGWKLSRCVFVGDAGMVSQDNLERLSTSGRHPALPLVTAHPRVSALDFFPHASSHLCYDGVTHEHGGQAPGREETAWILSRLWIR
jgi:transposase